MSLQSVNIVDVCYHYANILKNVLNYISFKKSHLRLPNHQFIHLFETLKNCYIRIKSI